MRTHIDYWDIIYYPPLNVSFCEKLEPVQYKAALAIAAVIQDLPKKKLFMEFGLEPRKSRRSLRGLCYMFKITKDQASEYLNSLITKCRQNFNT